MNKIQNKLTVALFALLFGAAIAALSGSLLLGFVFAALKWIVGTKMVKPEGAFGEGLPTGKTVEEIKAEIEAKQKAINESIAAKAAQEEVNQIRQELDKLKEEKQSAEIKAIEAKFEEIKAANITIGEEMTKLKMTGLPSNKPNLPAELKAAKEGLKLMAKGKHTDDAIEVKALTLRSAITDNENAFDLPDIGQLAYRKLSMYDIFPKMSMGAGSHNGTIRYYDWDEATIVRAAAAVAEGDAFPESTAKFKKYSIELQKIGDTLAVTEEFFEDEVMFAAELGLFLQTNVAIEIDRQLALGDGTGNQITGLFPTITAYTPAAAGIQNPSIYDLIIKVKEAITTTGGAKYTPDVVIMNISDINKYKLTKDQNDNYVLPPFVSRDGGQIDGMIVIEANIVTANTLALGDRRYARIYEMAGMEIAKGYSGTQFVEDEMTLKVRKRMAFLIRNADLGGWKKVTDISAAINTLGN
jgi:HK97 family phage major capsid protein